MPESSALLFAPNQRQFGAMSKKRFDVPLPVQAHAQLESLGEKIGVSPRDIVRLLIYRALNNPDELLGRPGVPLTEPEIFGGRA
jgi:hypothetical protein